jgi:transposase
MLDTARPGMPVVSLFAAEGGRAVLVELSVMEQRYHAVMEVMSGAPVTEVAGRYGVSRQAVHTWLGRYQREGLEGLADHSHRPHSQPRQVHPDVEALICQLRGAHPRWGPRRLAFELGKANASPVPSLSTVYRVLVRHGLVAARKRKRKRRRQDYKRWQREAPMQLWQLEGFPPLTLPGSATTAPAPQDHPRPGTRPDRWPPPVAWKCNGWSTPPGSSLSASRSSRSAPRWPDSEPASASTARSCTSSPRTASCGAPCPAPSRPAGGTGCKASASPAQTRCHNPAWPSNGAYLAAAVSRSPASTSRSASPHAGKTVTIELGHTTLRVIDSNGELITTVPRNSTGEISRFKAYGTRTPR